MSKLDDLNLCARAALVLLSYPVSGSAVKVDGTRREKQAGVLAGQYGNSWPRCTWHGWPDPSSPGEQSLGVCPFPMTV